METTFITIHDLSADALILYSSDSIVDILGYSPEEVIGRPCWDFFHPDEIPIARARHGRGVELDKAALLAYCRIRDKDGRWVGCEVVFTVVFDVLVGCTSIYRRGARSQNRAIEAPVIRKMFSSSPRDPRYHMLTHLSRQFEQLPPATLHEPRAALFLNRYTRSLTIMYATNGLADVLGIAGEDMHGLSFYYCIEDSCLQDAVRCLESAKANDSLAYLRFLFRDPREDAQSYHSKQLGLDGNLGGRRRTAPTDSLDSHPQSSTDSDNPVDASSLGVPLDSSGEESRDSSRESNSNTHEAIFGSSEPRQSSASSVSDSPNIDNSSASRSPGRRIELEAVVSCTSDGMVVCLRQASSQSADQARMLARQPYDNGLFAAPWAREPILPEPQLSPGSATAGSGTTNLRQHPGTQDQGTSQTSFMDSIRDAAIFAWALVGINGSLADYSRGQPRGEAQPLTGLAVWEPELARPGGNSAEQAIGEQVHGYSVAPSVHGQQMGGDGSTDATSGPMDVDHRDHATQSSSGPGLER